MFTRRRPRAAVAIRPDSRVLEVLLELFGELLLQLFGELFVSLGLHGLKQPFEREPNLWLAAISYALLGAAMGGLSLLIFPDSFVPPAWRLANLIAAPLVAGGLMAVLGALRAKRGQAVLRIDRFGCGYVFALAFALLRYRLAH